MSRIVEFPARRTPVRTAVLDLVGPRPAASARRRPSSSRRCAGSWRAPRPRTLWEKWRGVAPRPPRPHLRPLRRLKGQRPRPIRGSVPASSRRMLARWRTKTSAASATPEPDRVGPAEEREPDRRRGRGDQRRERGEAEGEGGGEPGGAGGEARRPGERQRHAEEGRDALAAAEPQPDREEVPEEGREARDHRRRLAGERAGDEHRDARPCRASSSSVAAAAPLLPVRSTLVAPMLPEPMRAQVAEAERAGDQHAEGDRAEQVGEERRRGRGSCRPPRAKTSRPPTQVRSTRPCIRRRS